MSTQEIVFDAGFPELFKQSVEHKLQKLAFLLPNWLRRLYVGYSAQLSDDASYINVTKQYRWARLTICGSYAEHEDYLQTEILAHELIHLHNLDFVNYVRDLVNVLCPETESPQLHATIQRELTHRMEAMTEDLALAAVANLEQS